MATVLLAGSGVSMGSVPNVAPYASQQCVVCPGDISRITIEVILLSPRRLESLVNSLKLAWKLALAIIRELDTIDAWLLSADIVIWTS